MTDLTTAICPFVRAATLAASAHVSRANLSTPGTWWKRPAMIAEVIA
jgi:hypothetical protein